MKIIEPSFTILSVTDPDLLLIEQAGRVCYRSEDRIEPGTAPRFARAILDGHHESVIEHGGMTVRLTVDRGVTHELVRHRIASFSQESQRYCSYAKGKFGGHVSFIRPPFWDEGTPLFDNWRKLCDRAETAYFVALEFGAKPEQARTMLTNSVASTIVITANYREWRQIFRLRTANDAHPQMRQVMRPLLVEARKRVPVVFDDVGVVE